jgi:hypothetical protein
LHDHRSGRRVESVEPSAASRCPVRTDASIQRDARVARGHTEIARVGRDVTTQLLTDGKPQADCVDGCRRVKRGDELCRIWRVGPRTGGTFHGEAASPVSGSISSQRWEHPSRLFTRAGRRAQGLQQPVSPVSPIRCAASSLAQSSTCPFPTLMVPFEIAVVLFLT